MPTRPPPRATASEPPSADRTTVTGSPGPRPEASQEPAESPPSDTSMMSGPDGRALARRLAVPAGAYLASRVLVFLAVATDVALRPGTGFLDDLTRWDADWYLRILSDGYPAGPVPDGQNATAFFPLFPLLGRAVAAATPLGAIEAAVLVAVAGGLAATIAVWVLAADLWDDATADRAAVLFALFPASYVFSIPYSEGVMVALSAGALVALERRRWLLAGVLAALSTASRPNAVAIVLAAALAAGLAIRERRTLRPLVAPALAPFGAIAFTAYLWVHTGDPLVSLRAQRTGWDQRFDFGATTVRSVARSVVDPVANLNNVGVTFALLVTALGLTYLVRDRRWVLVAYVAGVMAPVLIATTPTPKPRFVLAAFPVVLAIASRLRGNAHVVVAATSAGLLCITTILALSGLWLTP